MRDFDSSAFPTHPSPLTAHRRKALGMVEAVVSTLIVGVLVVSALNTVAASRTGVQRIGERGRGALLAQHLMADVLQCEYEDPTAGSLVLGPDGLEAGGGRGGFNDVDDYNGWTESPPQFLDGTEIAGFEDWERRVTVDFVDPNDLTAKVLTNNGVKRIVVTVRHLNRDVAAWTALRCSAGWKDVLSAPIQDTVLDLLSAP